ncbi:MAG TPA: hypothetical protein VFV57_03155 [Limnobacter sp.]|nr:hypothetical protein [Limnobacter sp.]
MPNRTEFVHHGDKTVPIAISTTPPSCLSSPGWDQKSRAYTARKARMASAGDGYWKKLTNYSKFLNFLAAGRGPATVGKAWQESGEHVAAAVLRTQRRFELSVEDQSQIDHKLWRSEDVAQSLMRQDAVRYRPEYFRGDYRALDQRRAVGEDKKPKPLNESNKENRWALHFGKLAHRLHGVCEIFAAPTGMTSNVLRNAVSPHATETGTETKVVMTGTLWGIGLGTTHLLGASADAVTRSGVAMGQVLAGLLVAFPAVSSFMGLMGVVSGATSQALLKKPHLNPDQIKIIEQDVSDLLHKLHFRIDNIKDDPTGQQIVSKAMRGTGIGRKVEDEFLNQDGMPLLLESLINTVKTHTGKAAQIQGMQTVIGDYLLQGVEPLPSQPTLIQIREHNKQVETREKHFRALSRLVNHSEIDDPAKDANEDMRRYGEKMLGIDFLHNNVFLKGAALICRLSFTRQGRIWADKFTYWTTDQYKKERIANLKDPTKARDNRFNPDYMLNNLHQYGAITRVLLRTADFMRMINLNVVLASNAQLSRCFNNLALYSQRKLTGGLASRSMCSAIGRFLGGALLATIVGFLIPAAAEATGDPYRFEGGVPGNEITLDFASIGILMFLLSVPTLMVHGLAIGAACVEGWHGDRRKEPSKKIATGAAVRWGD